MNKGRLKAKIITGAISLAILPALVAGTVSNLATNSLKEQILSTRQTQRQQIEQALNRQLSLVTLVTATSILLSSALLFGLIMRILSRIFQASETSNTLVNRVYRKGIIPKSQKDALSNLETNLNIISQEIPNLLWQQEFANEPFQVLMNISRHIWQSFSQEDVLKTTVEEVRKILKIDRVVIFRFDSNGEGTFVAESVAPIWPKTLWATIKDSYFEKDYTQMYHGLIHVINDIYQAELSEEHLILLERFAVKATMIAPIIQDDNLYGLLIAHQCSNSRFWEQVEINLFAQIASQVGFALAHANLIEQVDIAANQAQLFTDITLQLRSSLREEDILKTTVEEVRKALSTDRVIVYGFDSDWYGTIIAESVLPGFPKSLWARIKDPCFAEGFVESYQKGRIHVLDNIYEAGLTECYLKQLEPFEVKANLVASILKDDKLFGLLIAHQCSGPRNWQQSEIDLLAQIATQVGFALDHARLLAQVEENYHNSQLANQQQQQQQELLQCQVLETISQSQSILSKIAIESLKQIELNSADNFDSENQSILEMRNFINQTSKKSFKLAESLKQLSELLKQEK